MAKNSTKLVALVGLFSLLTVFLVLLPAHSVYYQGPSEPYQFPPWHTAAEVADTATSGCMMDSNNCGPCTNDYKMDCAFYTFTDPSQCRSLYSDESKFSSCVMMVFNTKIKDSSRISDTCSLFTNTGKRLDSYMGCYLSLVPYYGKEGDEKLCDQISAEDLRDSCLADFAVKNSKPEICAEVKELSNAINCCLDSKYKFADYYITSRQDLIDAYTALHGKELDECRKIVKIKPAEIVQKCEKVNCDCLDPCNKLASAQDKQIKCAQDCGTEYAKCYQEARTEMVEEKRNMYYYQTMNGGFSRKHCPHSLLPDSAGDTLDSQLTGTVSDFEGYPLPYLVLTLSAGGSTASAITSETGDFTIPLSGLKWKTGQDYVEANLTITFSYVRDGMNYFNLAWHPTGKLITYQKTIKIKDANDLTKNIQLDAPEPTDILSTGTNTNIKHFAKSFVHMHEAVDFYLKKLDLKDPIGARSPVNVIIGNNNGDTLYSPNKNAILISSNDAGAGSTNRPKNREYHEYSHFVMYTLYGSWTTGSEAAGVKNHAGFANPNTGDSFEEGFAEFMALVISDYSGDKNPAIYAGFGSLEQNYRPWDANGKLEEFGAASTMWDIYDKENDAGDSLQMPLDEIWSVIKVKRTDFYDYYKAFRDKWPAKAKDIDALFVAHGFFADNTTGDKNWEAYEPYVDLNKNWAKDANENFFDLAGKTEADIKLDANETIGKAAHYERPDRSTAVMLGGAFLKMSAQDSTCPRYTVSVAPSQGLAYSYETSQAQGKIYLMSLPSNVEAAIKVSPSSSAGCSGTAIYSITNRNLIAKIQAATPSTGYFDSFTFGAKISSSTPNATKLYLDGAPLAFYPETEKTKEVSVPNVDYSALNEAKKTMAGAGGIGGFVPYVIGGVVLVVAVVFALKFLKKGNGKGKEKKSDATETKTK
jgi:hypothetical protein